MHFNTCTCGSDSRYSRGRCRRNYYEKRSFFRFYAIDSLSNVHKHFIQANTSFSWYFRSQQLVFISHISSHVGCDSYRMWGHVAFVTAKTHYKTALVMRSIFEHFVNPILGWLESAFISQVITNNRTHCIPVVKTDHWTKLFMASSVPNVKFNLLLTCTILTWKGDNLLHISSPYCYIVKIIKFVHTKPLCYRWFTNSTVP